jgi:hypothetical protein
MPYAIKNMEFIASLSLVTVVFSAVLDEWRQERYLPFSLIRVRFLAEPYARSNGN